MRPPVGYGGNTLVATRGTVIRVGTQNRRLRRRYDDLDSRAKAVHEQFTGGVSIIGSVCDKPGHVPIKLVKQLGQSGRITHTFGGQIRADDLASD